MALMGKLKAQRDPLVYRVALSSCITELSGAKDWMVVRQEGWGLGEKGSSNLLCFLRFVVFFVFFYVSFYFTHM